ncbi:MULTISPECIES: hypothetical protein [unclassified Pseudodesulfovibrio]|uniref:hypothetical protein n=1 Tax=unclassified Pseudodesulfovibrio TaxID=2661612 RepID=UPI000FEB7457|nr:MULTISPECIES: hypothetical protein [unclassified Pseudodesulfovibrio]MCJ2163137.1 hypothetical protein [Pseudodesulfovibrio sp. S3-i]RWU07129.1 hypothetical protein DWB63_01070 [Pseudodesulfovibrio sp. S3]
MNPDYDSIQEIISRVASEVCEEEDIGGYAPEIPAALAETAVQNIKENEERLKALLGKHARFKKSRGGQLQSQATEKSASKIMRAAARIASNAGRRHIIPEDVTASIKELWCTIWPFCMPE